jgi:hypothetical protein
MEKKHVGGLGRGRSKRTLWLSYVVVYLREEPESEPQVVDVDGGLGINEKRRQDKWRLVAWEGEPKSGKLCQMWT